MSKQIAAIFFLIAFAAQSFNGAVIVLDYFTNTASFAKNCENKARPLMHCNGKCQLMKKLKEEEKKNQQVPERKASGKNEVVSSKHFFISIAFYKEAILPFFSSYFNSFFPKGSYADIFHPPGLV